MRSIWALARVTFLELVRQKYILLLGFVGVFLLSVSFFISTLSFDEKLRILIHLGFSSFQFILVSMALLVGSNHWQKEIERQTLLLLVSRPLSRVQIFYGKFIGIGMLLVVFSFLFLCLHYLMIGHDVKLSRFLWAHLDLLIEAFFVLAISFSLSLKLRPALSFATSFSFWLAGHWQSELAFFAKKSQSWLFHQVLEVSPYFFPQFVSAELRSVYFMTEELIQNWGGSSLLQIFLLANLWLLLGERLFNKRDLI